MAVDVCSGLDQAARCGEATGVGELVGDGAIMLREIPGRGVAAFAARAFQAGEVVLKERALVVSSVAVREPGGERRNWRLWEALVQEERCHRLPVFDASGHLGALAALRDLGSDGCRQKVLSKCCTGPLPGPKEAKREVEVLRSMVRAGLLPSSTMTFPAADYARLRLVFQLNGFRFNGDIAEGEPGYDVGEALFNNICRFNHSCAPNLEFALSWSEDLQAVVNCVTATTDVEEGCEVNISYLPQRLQLLVAERRRQLREHWGFDCDCPLCMAEAGPPAPPPQARQPEETLGCAAAPVAAESQAARGGGESSSDEGICWDDLRDPDDG